MVIAVYADLKSYRSNTDLYFIKDLLHHLALNYPHNRYYLIQPNSMNGFDGEISSFSLINLKISPGFLYNFRANSKVDDCLKKIKADILFCIDTIFKTSVNQKVLLTNLNIKKLTTRKLEKPTAIFVLSQQTKNTLNTGFGVDSNKIFILYGGASKIFEPMDDEIKSLIKDKYTDGKEFFIYRGRVKEINNTLLLLKAFSLFKKRQKSSMKLVLMGKVFWENSDFNKLLTTYKYRDDVVMIVDELLAEEASVLSAAYALIQPYATHNLFLFDAMQSAVPVLTVKESSMEEITSDGVIFFTVSGETDLADKMMLVYKDEALRKQLIEKGKDIIIQYNWQKTIDIVAQNLQE